MTVETTSQEPTPSRLDRQPKVELSVVVPVYKCRDCIMPLYERLKAVLDSISPKWEVIFVDDRSPDDAWPVLTGLARVDPAIKVFRLSRNFGQHAAITAGLAATSGRWVVVMDCDLQEPPEVIPRLYARAQQGFDIVLARRTRRRHARYRHLAALTYFKLMRLLTGLESTGEYGTLSIVSRKVVDAFLRLRDKDRHYLLILNWLGFNHDSIDFEHEERTIGESSYNLRRLIQLSLDGLFFQTTTLLKFIVYLGFALAAAGALLALYFILVYFSAHPYPYPGWTSLSVLILITGGFIIISTGVTGLYIGKIFQQVKDRPLYVVDESVTDGGVKLTLPDASARPVSTRHG